MTFDDDCVRIDGQFYSCRALGLEWPPPDVLYLSVESPGLPGIRVSPPLHSAAIAYRQVNRSQISDEQRAGMTHVFRGAEYEAVTG